MGENTPKVLCSHRSVDKPAVEDIARRLRERGIDAWLDIWEVAAGDDVVAQINEGLGVCQAVLIFFSRQTASGAWVTAEISAAIARMIEDGVRVIPVLIDDDAPIPRSCARGPGGGSKNSTPSSTALGRSPKPPLALRRRPRASAIDHRAGLTKRRGSRSLPNETARVSRVSRT